VHELSTEVELLDEVFGCQAIATLHELLPKINEENPFQFNQAKTESKYSVSFFYL